VREGEALAGAVRVEERELRPGRAPQLEAEGLVAGRTIPGGTIVEAGHVRGPSARAGEAVKVVISVGALAVEQTGRSVPCGRGRACAVLPSGRHVEGTFADGRLHVRLP
jgi:hypothetical protein